MNRLLLLLVVGLLLVLTRPATAGAVRTWTDSTGKYTIEASLIAFNDHQVIIERASDKELGAVDVDKLSDADREYLATQEAVKAANDRTGELQRWTLANSLQVNGRLVDYAHREVVVRRSRGKVYVNDRVLGNLPPIYQRIIPQIVANAGNKVTDEPSLTRWLSARSGKPQTFTVDGVVLELENGDEYVVPFFMFSHEDLNILQVGWDEWLAAHSSDNHKARQQEALQLQVEAARYHKNQEQQQRIAEMQFGLQAVDAGVTSMWEVTLYPARGNSGQPLWVTGFARDSRSATEQALAKHPGYVAGPVRRVSR